MLVGELVVRRKKEDSEESPKQRERVPLRFFSSGCTPLDLVLGGGFPLGRMSNIIGDKSSGKTLLAIEACANFDITFPEGKMYYHEAEAAFDDDYARRLGMPVDRITFIRDIDTVEVMFEKLLEILQENNEILYIIDSLDAISDKSEKERKIDAGSYGGDKPKKMSELFRRLAKSIENSQMHLMIISQERDKIGVTFGRKSTRSGGRALDFYASQILWLAEIGKIKRTIQKVDRKIGIEVKAKCEKNKVGLPFRECEIPILFGYGIDNITACLTWLKSVGRLEESGFTTIGTENIETELDLAKKVTDLTIQVWNEIEENFRPKVSKY
jgi:recombination protein RecA